MTKHMWNGVQLKKTSSQYAIFKLILSPPPPPPQKNPKHLPQKQKGGRGYNVISLCSSNLHSIFLLITAFVSTL